MGAVACTEQGVEVSQKLLKRASGCRTTVDVPEGMVHITKWRSYPWSTRGINRVGPPEGGYGHPRLRLQGLPGAPGAGSNGVLLTESVLWLKELPEEVSRLSNIQEH